MTYQGVAMLATEAAVRKLKLFSNGEWHDTPDGTLHPGRDAIAFYTEQKVIMSRWF